MKILLADKQDITRAGLIYVIEKMEGLETKYVEDKTELMLALRENEDTVVILDYTLSISMIPPNCSFSTSAFPIPDGCCSAKT